MNIHFHSLDIGDVFEFKSYSINYCIHCHKSTYYIKDYGAYCYCYDCKYKYSSSYYEYVYLVKTILI